MYDPSTTFYVGTIWWGPTTWEGGIQLDPCHVVMFAWYSGHDSRSYYNAHCAICFLEFAAIRFLECTIRHRNSVFCDWETREVRGRIIGKIIAASNGHEKRRTTFTGTSGVFANVPLLPGEEYIVFVGTATQRITMPSKFATSLFSNAWANEFYML